LYLAERNIYGSNRLGLERIDQVIASSDAGEITINEDTNRYVGDKRFELSNHLGNVLDVITDRKLAEETTVNQLCFDRASSEYGVSKKINASLGDDVTLEAWIKTSDASNTQTIAYHGSGSLSIYLFVKSGVAYLTGGNSGGGSGALAGTTQVADGQWHHIVGTSANGVWKIYVDGELEGSTTGTAGNFNGLFTQVYVGKQGASTNYFNGCIKEVSLWDYDKTASEILEDYSDYTSYSTSATGLKAYFKLNEGSGTVLNDHASSNLDSILVNTPTWDSDAYLSYYLPDVQSYSDYEPFGMLLAGRNGGVEDFRYTFQGQESDDEIKGEGNSINYTYRMHDPRIGRFFTVDPLATKYPFYSPYAFSGNRVIDMVELEGLEPTPSDEMDREIKPDGTVYSGYQKRLIDKVNAGGILERSEWQYITAGPPMAYTCEGQCEHNVNDLYFQATSALSDNPNKNALALWYVVPEADIRATFNFPRMPGATTVNIPINPANPPLIVIPNPPVNGNIPAVFNNWGAVVQNQNVIDPNLRRIARTLNNNPNANLTLQGLGLSPNPTLNPDGSGRTAGDNANDRAAEIRNQLINNFGVDPSQITIGVPIGSSGQRGVQTTLVVPPMPANLSPGLSALGAAIAGSMANN
jgi:RHS repeat-associated protein